MNVLVLNTICCHCSKALQKTEFTRDTNSSPKNKNPVFNYSSSFNCKSALLLFFNRFQLSSWISIHCHCLFKWKKFMTASKWRQNFHFWVKYPFNVQFCSLLKRDTKHQICHNISQRLLHLCYTLFWHFFPSSPTHCGFLN